MPMVMSTSLKAMKETTPDQMTVVMVTHLIEEAVELADEIVVFSARPGRVVERVPVDLPRPRNRRSAPFYALVDRLAQFVSTDG